MILDLDGFQLINDTHGHGVGDELPVGIANTLRRRLRTSVCIARIAPPPGPLSRGPPTL
jgi:diguanylate cyclase (GGDEF)-like protein